MGCRLGKYTVGMYNMLLQNRFFFEKYPGDGDRGGDAFELQYLDDFP